jgi:hypothetical protein
MKEQTKNEAQEKSRHWEQRRLLHDLESSIENLDVHKLECKELVEYLIAGLREVVVSWRKEVGLELRVSIESVSKERSSGKKSALGAT